MSDGGWALTSARPLAFGGWEFVYTAQERRQRLTWYPEDPWLRYNTIPMRSARVEPQTAKGARAAADKFAARLNEDAA